MANGDDFSPDELRELVRPLELLRRAVDSYALSKGIETNYYSKGWPNIALRWTNGSGLHCLVQLYLDAEKSAYILWASASKDVERERYFQKEELRRGMKPPFDADFILAEIKKGVELCNSWKVENLSLKENLR